jgi:hypothetical protein
VVEQVIKITANFKCQRLSDLEPFSEREIRIPQPRLRDHHPRCRSKARCAHNLERIDVEVSIFSPVTARKSLFSNQVRAVETRPGIGLAGAIADLSGVPGLRLGNEVRLPPAKDLAQHAFLIPSIREIVDNGRHQPVPDVEGCR